VTERVKAPFLWRSCDHDRVIYRFNSHPQRTRCCVLWWDGLRWLSLLDGFEQAVNSMVRLIGGHIPLVR